jgi:hypothetical protein
MKVSKQLKAAEGNGDGKAVEGVDEMGLHDRTDYMQSKTIPFKSSYSRQVKVRQNEV